VAKRTLPNQALVTSAREGSNEAIGQVLESCRAYLMLMADGELDRELRAKLGPSDLVQETIIAAQRGFADFVGATPEELIAWLREILSNKLKDARRRYMQAKRRAVRREAPLDGSRSGVRAANLKLTKGNTPSRQLEASEEAERVSLALSSLSPDYQMVIQLRNWQLLPFEEIGGRMNRSAGAARALWIRALEQLAKKLEGRDGQPRG